mmetsp:Transcript_28901/g.50845  ORF Transcript_28901/g.50845 Transcript_28901/m.50845 type:complete len:117 (-) Transcript_28901:154-504(-)
MPLSSYIAIGLIGWFFCCFCCDLGTRKPLSTVVWYRLLRNPPYLRRSAFFFSTSLFWIESSDVWICLVWVCVSARLSAALKSFTASLIFPSDSRALPLLTYSLGVFFTGRPSARLQ